MSKKAKSWFSKSIFYVKNHPNHTNLGAHFLLSTFFDNINILITSLLKWCPIFDSSPLHQFSKFNIFLWACWFLGKNLSNFEPPAWKLDNPYYHNLYYVSANIWKKSHLKSFNPLGRYLSYARKLVHCVDEPSDVLDTVVCILVRIKPLSRF